MFENEHEHEHHHHHEHDHEHNHEEEHIDAFTLVDEEGNEHNFVLLGEVENKGKTYWVCEEIFVETKRYPSLETRSYSQSLKIKKVMFSSIP